MEDVIDKIPQLTEEKKEGGREEKKRTGSKASRRIVKFKQDPNCGKPYRGLPTILSNSSPPVSISMTM
jgi:hypothetical protein